MRDPSELQKLPMLRAARNCTKHYAAPATRSPITARGRHTRECKAARPAVGRGDFQYSAALKVAGFSWNEATLDAWLADPERLVPGQKMGGSVPAAQDRADMIAYLKAESARK